MVADAYVAELECKGDEGGDEIWCVEATVDEDGALDVGVGEVCK